MYSEKQNAKKIINKINKILSTDKIKPLSQIFKWASTLMTTILRYSSFINCNIQYVHTIIQHLLTNHAVFVNLIQFYKYFHKFQYFMNQLKRYEKTFNVRLSLESQTQNFSQINQKLKNYKQNYQNNFSQISTNQQQFLNSNKLTQCLVSLSKNQIIINNSNCVCCSPVFIKDFQIYNKNSSIQNIVALTQKEGFNRVSLQRYMTAVLNTGGGVILIGAQNKNNKLKAVGINLKDINQKNQRFKQINQAIKCIKPPYFGSIQLVMVHNNFIQCKSFYEEKLRYIFRITILPCKPLKSHYLEINIKGYHTKYQIYKLGLFNKLIKYAPQSFQSQITIYNLIIQNYYSLNLKSIKPNSHQNIYCCRSIQHHSQSFLQNMQSQETVLVQNIKNYEQESGFTDQPKFQFPYQTLLSVGSIKNQRYIKELTPFLISRKFSFEIFKPFTNSFKQGARSIWVISHQDKYGNLKLAIKQYDKGGNITIMPVFHTIQIERTKFSQYNEKVLEKRFKQRYLEGYRTEQRTLNASGVIALDLLFNNYTHSIYAYLLFDELKLWPYFVQDNTTYKKKLKKNANQY